MTLSVGAATKTRRHPHPKPARHVLFNGLCVDISSIEYEPWLSPLTASGTAIPTFSVPEMTLGLHLLWRVRNSTLVENWNGAQGAQVPNHLPYLDSWDSWNTPVSCALSN
ncbi:hypothetical protein AJ79_00147 [Helicocarpus griseus UAMH5409]|uniref:Uncharacterized protein n=1 Tax=Helicocarpus griseus UAMH5409 TaxID=1447875 RepID=A0A2B7Y3Q1_9EURO|nr:hypothetical protein AJ79_00147 [Helicocarpus griseus UAMH5409]